MLGVRQRLALEDRLEELWHEEDLTLDESERLRSLAADCEHASDEDLLDTVTRWEVELLLRRDKRRCAA